MTMTIATGAKQKKILVEFPEDLLREADKLANELSTDRSKLIRSAVRAHIDRIRQKNLAKALAEGYKEYAEFDRGASAEFQSIDAENF
jgi:metal-responsive CopG/Arc/MetJ family transcriptional regulator